MLSRHEVGASCPYRIISDAVVQWQQPAVVEWRQPAVRSLRRVAKHFATNAIKLNNVAELTAIVDVITSYNA